jgi:hypothetical protein
MPVWKRAVMSKMGVGKCQQRKCQYNWSGWKMPVRNLPVHVIRLENASKELAGTSDPVGKCQYGKWQYIVITVLFIKTNSAANLKCKGLIEQCQ